MMRFLANENFPGDAVTALRSRGHDVLWVRESAPGMIDPDVLDWAMREERILVTFDKDFGNLAQHSDLPPACGIVLFRIPMPSPMNTGERLSAELDQRDDWAGHFSVIEPGRVRMRKLGD